MTEADFDRLAAIVAVSREHNYDSSWECKCGPCFLVSVLTEMTEENDRLRAVIASLVAFGVAVIE